MGSRDGTANSDITRDPVVQTVALAAKRLEENDGWERSSHRVDDNAIPPKQNPESEPSGRPPRGGEAASGSRAVGD